MAKKWAEILKDSATYGDDFVVTLKDGQTLSLGEMRAYDTETRGELTRNLTAKEKEIAKRESDLNNATIQVGTLVEKTAAAAGLTVDELLAGKAPSKKAVAAATELDEGDPLIGVVVKEIKKLQQQNEALSGQVTELKKNALGPMLNTYLEDYYESAWEKLEPTLPKGASVKREDALKYAQDNGYKDARGRLDLRKAVKDLTYDARIEAEAEKRVADKLKKQQDEAVLASVPKPSGVHVNQKTAKSLLNEKGQTKNFDEVLNDAMADTDMWRKIQQAN